MSEMSEYRSKLFLQRFKRVVLPAVHFLPATFLFLAGLLWFLGERNCLKLFLTAACADAAVYVLFGVLLHVRLP